MNRASMPRGKAHVPPRLSRIATLSWRAARPAPQGRLSMHARVLRALLPLLVIATAGARAADEPPLLPLNAFFAHPNASWEYRVSPDGTRLAWVAMRDGRATLHFR